MAAKPFPKIGLDQCKLAEQRALGSAYAREMEHVAHLAELWTRRPPRRARPRAGEITDADLDAMDKAWEKRKVRVTPAQGLAALKAREAAGEIEIRVHRHAIYVEPGRKTPAAMRDFRLMRIRRRDLKRTG